MILGRQPALGVAELESLYGAAKVRLVGDHAAIVSHDTEHLDFTRLGGSVKACRLLTTLDTTDWNKLERYLLDTTPEHAGYVPDGKLTIGLSAIGLKVTPGKLNATGLSIKKAIRKASDRSVRLVPNVETELSSAQVLHNQLTGERGWELVLVADGTRTHLAQTYAVQDIDSYTLRDRGRPKRDAKVGMLPPKLAQIIINLAAGEKSVGIVLDPFCGTGVVLQEALLMGYDVYGTDLEPRMVDYTGENLDWLDEQFDISGREMRIEAGDAISHTWEPIPDLVAGETYLGRPFTARPDRETLERNAGDCNQIIKKFLTNIHDQLAPGTRLCLAVPAWQTGKDHFKHLPLLDQLNDLGYERVSFEHVRPTDLLYYRTEQLVARELLVLRTT